MDLNFGNFVIAVTELMPVENLVKNVYVLLETYTSQIQRICKKLYLYIQKLFFKREFSESKNEISVAVKLYTSK